MYRELEFSSEGVRCAARLFEPEGPRRLRPCVLMGHGFSLTTDDGLGRFGAAFAAAGLVAFAFDYRYFGRSGGEPRQRFRRAEQRQDWLAAHRMAAGLPGVDRERIVPWGYSFGGGHLVRLLAEGRLRAPAAIVLTPFVDGLRRVLAMRPGDLARVAPAAVADALGIRRTLPVAAEPGTAAAMSFPGEARGFARAVPAGSSWRNEVGAGVLATVALHRPWLRAKRIACPLWVGLGERDVTADPESVRGLARRAPRGELHRYPYDHFEPLLAENAPRLAADQVAFLRRVGLDTP